MAIDKVASVAGAGSAPALGGAQEQRFSSLMARSESAGRAGEAPLAAEGQRLTAAPPGAQHAQARPCASAGKAEAAGSRSAAGGQGVTAAQLVDRVSQAQQRLDHVLRLAETGKSFTPVELLAFQAHVYRASQELDLAGKVVEKATGGVKQVLQTQL
jgi:hypothetical protein